MLAFAPIVGYLAFGLAFLLAAWRLLRGPDLTDRLLALDTLYVNAMGLIVLVAMSALSDNGSRSYYYEVALLIALMGFVGTVAGARFLARGDAIE